jgi:hypothetical protein
MIRDDVVSKMLVFAAANFTKQFKITFDTEERHFKKLNEVNGPCPNKVNKFEQINELFYLLENSLATDKKRLFSP